MKAVALVLLSISLSFGLCPGSLNVSLDLHSETVEFKGSNYRRADVLLLIPVKLEKGEIKTLAGIRKHFSIKRAGSVQNIRVRISSITSRTIDNAYLKQELPEGSLFNENIKARKIISRNPLIVEPINLYPTDRKRNSFIVKMPPLRPGEAIELSYTIISSKKVQKPSVYGDTITLRKESDPVYILVGKYSIKFPFASSRTQDINLENIRDVIATLSEAGLKPIVKVFGIADGKTINRAKNERVARARARFVATEILGKNFACYVRRGFAEAPTPGER